MDMVERVAFAIAKARRAAEIERVKPSQLYDHLARAAIAAMREPTPEMVHVAYDHWQNTEAANMTTTYTAMIDAALTSSEK